MKIRFTQMLVAALAMTSAGVLWAAEPAQKIKAEQFQAIADAATDESSPALQAIAQFLQLRPEQTQAFARLLQARHDALAPALQQLQENAKHLEQLIDAGGPAPEVGQLVLQIYAIQKQVMLGQQEFLKNVRNVLDSDQSKRLDAVQLAAQLQPILPAFAQLALL